MQEFIHDGLHQNIIFREFTILSCDILLVFAGSYSSIGMMPMEDKRDTSSLIDPTQRATGDAVRVKSKQMIHITKFMDWSNWISPWHKSIDDLQCLFARRRNQI